MLQFKGIWTKRFSFVLILAIGIALRLYKWNGYSFWFDEVCWMPVMQQGLLAFLRECVIIMKPPLFRFIIYFWAHIGQSEFILRLLPFAFGVLSTLVVYKVAKKLFDEKIGLISFFLISLSPFHIYYSQELTDYSLTIFLALCSIYYLIRCLNEDTIYPWIKFILFTCLSVYTNYLCFFLIITENLFFFLSYARYKSLGKRWLLSQFAILLLYSPWLLMVPAQLHAFSYYFYYMRWIPKGSLAYIFQALRVFNVGYNADGIIHFIASLLFFPLLVIGIFSNLKIDGQKIKLLTLWLFTPVVLSILLSGICHSFTYRNFIFALPAYYILIACGIIKLKKYIYIPIVSFIILFSLSLTNYYRNILPYPEDFYRPGVHAKIDNRGAVKYITNQFKEGDIVIHTCASTALPYIYYLLTTGHEYIISEFFYDLCDASSKKSLLFYPWRSKFSVQSKGEISKFIRADTKRIWLVFSYWEPQALSLYPFMKENEIKKWMDNIFATISHKKFEGIDIFLYGVSNI